MSQPPPIPQNDGISPRREGSSNNNNNNDPSSPPPPPPPARGDEVTSPRPASFAASANAAVSPHTQRVHQLSHPGGGDMQSFFRQWGAASSSSSDADNAFSYNMGGGARGTGGMWANAMSPGGGGGGGGLESYDYDLRIDRSASFDDDPGRSASDLAAEADRRHRRTASTGGGMLPHRLPPLDLFAPALPPRTFDGGDAAAEGDARSGHSHGLSALHDAARITDWPAVAALSESDPESARYVGPDGWNALHHACDRRCPHVDVVDSLLGAYPEALVRTNDKGWTPLHRACRNKTPRDVVRLLLRRDPELGKRAAGMRCNDGRSALHYALLYDAPEGVVELLLQADPGAVLDEDRDGVSPLGTVWDKYANSFDGRRMLQILLRPFEGEGWELGGGAASDDDGEARAEEGKEGGGGFPPRRGLSDKEMAEKRVREAMEKDAPACKSLQANWQKANMLLRAYFRFHLQEEKLADNEEDPSPVKQPSKHTGSEITLPRKRKWRILHATSAIKCHPKLFMLARALHPEQAHEIDENDLCCRGDVVASSSSLSDPQSLTLSRRTVLHFAAASQLSGKEGRNVLKVLLKLNPLAAHHVDGHGSLPLHLICRNARKLQHWTNSGPKDVYAANQGATACGDGAGRTPLHCVASTAGQYAPQSPPSTAELRDHTEASVVLNLVRADGSAASVADATGRLPLHHIAERSEDWTPDARGVLEAHPPAASARAGPSAANQLPLHMAAASPDARPSLIAGLVAANPRAASMADGTGRLPLHLAVDSGRTSWDRGIAAIHDAYPPAISSAEDGSRRWMPLHTAAASHSAGLGLIQKIIELDNRDHHAASVPDGEGRYPLHLACAANRSWEEGGVRDIFDADPSMALSEDSGGLFPFHIAAIRSSRSVPSPSAASNVADGGGNELENKTLENTVREDVEDDDDLETLEVLFNLLIAQPSVVQV